MAIAHTLTRLQTEAKSAEDVAAAIVLGIVGVVGEVFGRVVRFHLLQVILVTVTPITQQPDVDVFVERVIWDAPALGILLSRVERNHCVGHANALVIGIDTQTMATLRGILGDVLEAHRVSINRQAVRDLGLFASIFGGVGGFGISNKLVIGGSARVAIFVGLHCDLCHAVAVNGWGQAEGRGDEELD